MEWISALVWALCCGGAQWLAIQKQILPYRELTVSARRCLTGAAVLAGALGGWFAMHRAALPDQLRLLLILMALCPAFAVDLTRKRIPNLLSLGLLGGFVLCTALDFLLRSTQALGLLAGSFLGGVGMLAVMGLCRLVSRGGVGMGDVKLLSAMGLLLGLYGSMCVLLYAQLAALVWAVALLVSRKASWKDTLPFAPFFTAGFLLCLILGTY